MNTPLRPRGLNASLAVLVAAALTFAGLAKVFSPEDLGLLRLLGDARRDPPWFSQVLAARKATFFISNQVLFRRIRDGYSIPPPDRTSDHCVGLLMNGG